MYCINCGKVIPDDSAFCEHCGKAQNAAPDQPPQPVAPVQPVAPPQPMTPPQPVVQSQPVAQPQPIAPLQPAKARLSAAATGLLWAGAGVYALLYLLLDHRLLASRAWYIPPLLLAVVLCSVFFLSAFLGTRQSPARRQAALLDAGLGAGLVMLSQLLFGACLSYALLVLMYAKSGTLWIYYALPGLAGACLAQSGLCRAAGLRRASGLLHCAAGFLTGLAALLIYATLAAGKSRADIVTSILMAVFVYLLCACGFIARGIWLLAKREG